MSYPRCYPGTEKKTLGSNKESLNQVWTFINNNILISVH